MYYNCDYGEGRQTPRIADSKLTLYVIGLSSSGSYITFQINSMSYLLCIDTIDYRQIVKGSDKFQLTCIFCSLILSCGDYDNCNTWSTLRTPEYNQIFRNCQNSPWIGRTKISRTIYIYFTFSMEVDSTALQILILTHFFSTIDCFQSNKFIAGTLLDSLLSS